MDVTVIETFGIVVLGVVARLLLTVIVVLGILTIPVLAILGVRSLYRRFRDRALGLAHVEGGVWAANVDYAPGHTWVRRLRRGGLRIGLDDLAQRLLGGGEIVEMPKQGSLVRAGEVTTVIRCGDKIGEIRSPVDGTVSEVNDAVVRNPSLIHREPYTRGWLYTVAPSGAGPTQVLRGEAARRWVERESVRLTRFLEHDLGLAAADGGEIVAPPPALLTGEQWTALTMAFLWPQEVCVGAGQACPDAEART
jgi:glycine cleavage system H lipoate-binding protein